MRDVILKGDVVGVLNVAIILAVLLHSPCEIGWNEAFDWMADVLLCRDQQGEHDQNDGSVQVMESVDEVIVRSWLQKAEC